MAAADTAAADTAAADTADADKICNGFTIDLHKILFSVLLYVAYYDSVI